ncbi:MAG TPA: lysoplasmalogenase [Candidatus Acidoferrales bacterium]|jgi:uncharacterized membrane protein YhhN|nr:lysoplasmalogenase [Candidatus Acidoferrales bacterium]
MLGTRPLAILAALAAIVDLICAGAGWDAARTVTKPLPALVLAYGAWRIPRVPRFLAAGLVAAAIGDELLLHAGELTFMLGMCAFAAMHVCYIAAFARLGRGAGYVKRLPWLLLPFAALVVGTNVILGPQAGTFALPVAVYSALLGAMAVCAVDAAGRVNARAAWLVAGGALAFMASDTTLAFAKFSRGFPLTGTTAELAIVGTYFLAQIAIATGVIEATE